MAAAANLVAVKVRVAKTAAAAAMAVTAAEMAAMVVAADLAGSVEAVEAGVVEGVQGLVVVVAVAAAVDWAVVEASRR